MTLRQVDYLIVGGGFYGCCLALYLRSISNRVLLVEAGDTLLDRASRVNQARVHTGFHYPRSALTAVKSMLLHRRFMADSPRRCRGIPDALRYRAAALESVAEALLSYVS